MGDPTDNRRAKELWARELAAQEVVEVVRLLALWVRGLLIIDYFATIQVGKCV